jgi:hypothetical protein
MTMDPLRRWDPDEEIDTSPDDDELELPPIPRLRRCGSIRDVGEGPWIGTLACCTRPISHQGQHSMALGDPGSSSYWQESWT